MMVWSSPLWLIGLAFIIPLMWWLHKFRRSGREIPVSSLVFWPKPAESGEAGRRTAAADRIWLLRALIGALLTLALAGPAWLKDAQPKIQVWVDDSLSMATVEDDQSRMTVALQKLLVALDERGSARVEVHSLTDPARPILNLSTEGRSEWPALLDDWAQLTDREPQPPDPLQMDTDVEHWVLTDGADEKLNGWIVSVPVRRIIRTGQATENTAIEWISLRPDPNRKDTWAGLIQIANLGLKPVSRKVGLFNAGHSQGEWELDLPAGATRQVEFELPDSPVGEVAARLSPADALNLDDRLALPVPKKVSAHITGTCGPHVMAALRAHPRITLGEDPQLAIVCGEADPPEGGAVLWLHQQVQGEGGRQIVPGSRQAAEHRFKFPALWLEGAGKLRNLFLASEWLSGFAAETGVAKPLLVAGSRPLISLVALPRRQVDCYLDLTQAEFVRQPEFPALIAGMIDTALGQELLDGIQRQSRPAIGSRIVPQNLPGLPAPDELRKTAETAPVDLIPGLILLVLPALLLDAWLSGERRNNIPGG